MKKNLERINKIKELRSQGFTLESIGKIFGVSRERIRQITLDIKPLKEVGKYTRQFVYHKYENKCFLCGSKEKLHIHHIDTNHDNNNPINLLLVCQRCHKGIHKELHNKSKKCFICKKSVQTKKYSISNDRSICVKCYLEKKATPSKRWATHYNKCVICESKEFPHNSHGVCSKCIPNYLYKNSEKRRKYLKEYGNKWRLNNPEKTKIINNRAIKKYQQKIKLAKNTNKNR